MQWLALPLLALALAACSTAPKKSPLARVRRGRQAQRPSSSQSQAGAVGCSGKYAPAQEDLSKRGDYKAGGLYAPGVADTTPDHVPDVDCIAEPVVTDEPRSPVGNRSPYSVLGKKYEVLDRVDGYVEQGTASYYGNKFHGRRTSNQEVYDMYAFTAAHKTLPLPSFARVTNLDNGKSVVVRVNDRGPFHDGRVIDLSYAAAVKLGITQRGTGRVEVRALTGKDQGSVLASTPPAPVRTTIATGIPTRIASGKPTAMDELVGKLPQVASAPAQCQAASPSTATTVAPASQSLRYHVAPESRRSPARIISTPGCARKACASPPASRFRSRHALHCPMAPCRSHRPRPLPLRSPHCRGKRFPLAPCSCRSPVSPAARMPIARSPA